MRPLPNQHYMKRINTLFIMLAALLLPCKLMAQVGEYRNTFSVGASGGYLLNTINFTPTVPQNMHGGMLIGLTGRYTTEKYFSTLCALQVELNMAQVGWKQDNSNIDGQQVINPETGAAEQYERNITYLQIPFFAHLSWGKETRGVNAFVNLGPQIGFMLSESTTKNYNRPYTKENFPDNFTTSTGRVSQVEAQETMPVENKLDFGIAFGAGIELHINKVGRFDLEGRFYYGLGNIYGDSKRDFFGTSNHNTIYIKLGYLYDI